MTVARLTLTLFILIDTHALYYTSLIKKYVILRQDYEVQEPVLSRLTLTLFTIIDTHALYYTSLIMKYVILRQN